MPTFQQRPIIHLQFISQLERGGALRNTPHHQHNLPTVVMGTLPDRVGENVKNVVTNTATIIKNGITIAVMGFLV
jgi:predicted amidohydrolase YtcJ